MGAERFLSKEVSERWQVSLLSFPLLGRLLLVKKILHPEDYQTLGEELLSQTRFYFSFWSHPFEECPFLLGLERRVSSFPSSEEQFKKIIEELFRIERGNIIAGPGYWTLWQQQK